MKIVHRVLFIRHGETEANVGSYFSGHTESNLTDKGKEQAKHAAKAIVDFAPDCILSSPILRCQHIAKLASEEVGCTFDIVDDLSEMSFGVMEGKHLSRLKDYGITFPWPRNESGVSEPCEGAETFEHAYERAARILEMVREGRGRTACCTHGGIMRCIIGQLLGIAYEPTWLLRIVNVSTLYLTCTDSGRITLEALGLTPEEVSFRSTHESFYDPFAAFEKTGDES